MSIFKRIFGYKIDNSNKVEPFPDEKNRTENKTKKEKTKLKWRFPLGPWKTLLTILSICFLAFSLSYYSAWLLGYQYTVVLLYIGVFSVTLMVLIDISTIASYIKHYRKIKEQEHSLEEEKGEE